MKKHISILILIISISLYSQNLNIYSDVNVSGTINKNVTVKVIDYTNIINQPMDLQKSINDNVNRLMQEQRDRDKVKRENERRELEKQTNEILVNTSKKMNQDDIDYYTTVFEKPIFQNEIKSSSKKEKIKPAEKKNLKLELENKFYDENSLVNQWIISLKEKLVNEYGESEKINSAIQELRDENNLIFDKYFEKKNLPEFYREANILKNKILDFKLE